MATFTVSQISLEVFYTASTTNNIPVATDISSGSSTSSAVLEVMQRWINQIRGWRLMRF